MVLAPLPSGRMTLTLYVLANLKPHTWFPFHETFTAITRERTASQSPYYETFSVGSRGDAGNIFWHANRGRAVLSGLQLFPAVGEHARYALLATPVDFHPNLPKYLDISARLCNVKIFAN